MTAMTAIYPAKSLCTSALLAAVPVTTVEAALVVPVPPLPVTVVEALPLPVALESKPVLVAAASPPTVPVGAPAALSNCAIEKVVESPAILNVYNSVCALVNGFPGKVVTGSVPGSSLFGRLKGLRTVLFAYAKA
jgi:hypothetical protein